jgi:hypothetical protein
MDQLQLVHGHECRDGIIWNYCSGPWQLRPAQWREQLRTRSFNVQAGADQAQRPKKERPRGRYSHRRNLSRKDRLPAHVNLLLTEESVMSIEQIVLGLIAGTRARMRASGRRSPLACDHLITSRASRTGLRMAHL